MKYPRSPYEQVGGIVYFGRMIDKIRLMAQGELHTDLHEQLGHGFDERCCYFLGIDYAGFAEKVREGLSDEDALARARENGKNPTDRDIEVWNGFMTKRGWKDNGTETLRRRITESGFEARTDIHTMFDYIDADEGRTPGAAK